MGLLLNQSLCLRKWTLSLASEFCSLHRMRKADRDQQSSWVQPGQNPHWTVKGKATFPLHRGSSNQASCPLLVPFPDYGHSMTGLLRIVSVYPPSRAHCDLQTVSQNKPPSLIWFCQVLGHSTEASQSLCPVRSRCRHTARSA